MRIDISFSLNAAELDLLLQQIRKEFAQHVEEFERLKRILPDTKDDKRRVNIQRAINVQGMKCDILCYLAKAYNADWFVHEGKRYSFSLFEKDADCKYLTTPNKKHKLMIHLMHRAGIITKEKMKEILKLRQYNGEEKTFKVLSHFKAEISKNLEIIQNRLDLKDLRKIMSGTDYLFGCIRDVMEHRKI